jgi:hypothetical protein
MIARNALALGSSVLFSAACVVSQPTPAAYPQGVQVRVVSAEAGPLPLEGTLIYAEADTLKLYVPRHRSTLAVPVGSVTRLEVYRGRKGSAGKAVKGAAIGTVAGAAMGAAIGATTEAIFGGMFGSRRDYGDAIAIGAADGAVTGAFVGATAGATVGDAVWQEVTVHDLRQELCHCRLPRAEG